MNNSTNRRREMSEEQNLSHRELAAQLHKYQAL